MNEYNVIYDYEDIIQFYLADDTIGFKTLNEYIIRRFKSVGDNEYIKR